MFSTFKGGIHPPTRKNLTENRNIENLPVPQICYIPMQQQSCVSAEIIVRKGDMINEGQLIGKAVNNLSTNIHATVPGKVIDIGEYPSFDGMKPTVVIEAEGAFITTGSSALINNWEGLDKNILLDIVRDSGIAGFEAVNLPSTDKLLNVSGKNMPVLIINGAESEPYLTSNDMLMKTYPSEILEGILIVLKMTGLKMAFIGIEDNKKQSINLLQEAMKRIIPDGTVSIKRLKTKYPQGSGRLLVLSILGKQGLLHTGSHVSDAMVLNVATIHAVREAVLFNKPVIDRYITVSGSMINRPGNYKVRIGTRISDIIEECGGLKGEPFMTVMGGPICGTAVYSTDIPVVKETTAILFFAKEEVKSCETYSCIRCGRCLTVCPAGLVPRDIASAAESKRFDLIDKIHVDACILCSCCSYICPSKRPLSYLINIARNNS